MIQYLSHDAIDKVKWDHCIGLAENQLIYGLSWFLDIMCPGWEALVKNDYEEVMPLTWKRKAGIYYLYQPFFVQQLGIFGLRGSAAQSDEFLKSIPSKFRLVDVHMNASFRGNELSRARKNYVLPLDMPYEAVIKNFRPHAWRNILLSRKNKIQIKAFEFTNSIRFFRDHIGDKIHTVKSPHYRRLESAMEEAHHRKQLLSICSCNLDGEVLAVATLFHFRKRIIFNLATVNPEGRKQRAMYAIIDYIIQQYAGTGFVLDFEGSEIESIEAFYKGFGASLQPYYHLRINKLPWPIRWLKPAHR